MNPRSEPVLRIDDAGWLVGAEHVPSPNCDARPSGEPIRLIVIHAISLPPGEFGGDAVIDFFTNRLDTTADPYFATLVGRRVSAHFFIRRDGWLVQFVSGLERAWHAGISCWRGQARCNDFSLGIELEGDDFSTFAPAQYATLNALIAALRQRFPIEGCIGHADIAPGRKTDPGPWFEWSRLVTTTAD